MIADISFCETDTATVEQSIIDIYEGITGATLYPGDPVRLFLESLAAVIGQQRVIIDQAGKSNLVNYAREAYLDHIGAMTDTPRLEMAKAIVKVRFVLSGVLGSVTPIAKGVRVSPDGKIFFETVAAAEIPAGESSLVIDCQCTEAGALGNGFLPGQITKLVDPIPYVASVINTTETTGGADLETDAAYVERIILAPEKYSVAGPDGAYQYWAKTANQNIIDIATFSPSPGVVNVIPLALGGTLPDDEILTAVGNLLNRRDKRPLTDSIQVLPPNQINYDISLTYYIAVSDIPLVAQIQANVNAAVENFKAWQKSKLGRDINPSVLTQYIMGAGAKRVSIISPTYAALEPNQVANDVTMTITYGGIEDE